MSDSSRNADQAVNNVDYTGRDKLRLLCEGGRVKVMSYGRFEFKKGWVHIIEDFLNTIRRLPVEITAVISDFGQLDIAFNIYQKTHEVKVWRAINKAQMYSRRTCMSCGKYGDREIRDGCVVVMCKRCVTETESNGETGTWLDKY